MSQMYEAGRATRPAVLGGPAVEISSVGLGEEAAGVFRPVPETFGTPGEAVEWVRRELEDSGAPWRLLAFSPENGLTLKFYRAMAENWAWWGVPPRAAGKALGEELRVRSATVAGPVRDTFIHRLPLESLKPAVVRALLTAIDKLNQWVSTHDFQDWAWTYEVLLKDRVIRVENGLVVGSLEVKGEPMTIGVTHPHVDYWDDGGPKGICNTCRAQRPKTCFGGNHPEGSCPMCGEPLPSDT